MKTTEFPELLDVIFENKKAGVYALLRKDNKYLTYFSEKTKEYWLPGGGIKPGESDVEALKREIIEETGYLDFKINKKISESSYNIENSEKRIEMTFYEVELLSDKSQDKQLTENEKEGESDNWISEWVDSEDFVQKMKESGSERSLALSVPFSKINEMNLGFLEGGVEFPRPSAFSLRPSAISSEIEVFTTRPDTLFGATYMVLAPEHKLVQKWKDRIENWDEVQKYLDDTKKKTELERLEGKSKTGVELKGVKAINPAIAKMQSQNNAEETQKDAEENTENNIKNQKSKYLIIENSLPSDFKSKIIEIAEIVKEEYEDEEWGNIWNVEVDKNNENDFLELIFYTYPMLFHLYILLLNFHLFAILF